MTTKTDEQILEAVNEIRRDPHTKSHGNPYISLEQLLEKLKIVDRHPIELSDDADL